jgi:hypothetical protein
MIPPSGYGQPEMYPSSSGNNNSSSYTSGNPNSSANGGYGPSLYNMPASYEYPYAYLPHNYPPFNPNSV